MTGIKPKLIIADMYRGKNKLAFFAMHQASTKLSEFDIEFHILWDQPEYSDEWTTKINDAGFKIVSYTKEQLNNYCIEYGIAKERVESFPKFKNIYHLLLGHYLKKNNICEYYLIYDDDIILQDDLNEFKECLLNQIPCLISEPMNSNCDKVLFDKLLTLYGGQYAFDYYKHINPNLLGFNAGIQGLSLDMYEDFLENETFNLLIELFDYSGIFDTYGKEITGPQRTAIDTQQQSFFSIMNIIRSKTPPVILNPLKYFVCPNWGTHPIYGEIDSQNEYQGWDVNMKSKIIHFIGHTVLNGKHYGKPKIYHELVDKYLSENNII